MPNDTTSTGAAHDLVLQRLQRGLPCSCSWMLMPLVVERLLEVGEAVVGGVDDRRHVVAEGVDLVGDRVGEQQAGDRRGRTKNPA